MVATVKSFDVEKIDEAVSGIADYPEYETGCPRYSSNLGFDKEFLADFVVRSRVVLLVGLNGSGREALIHALAPYNRVAFVPSRVVDDEICSKLKTALLDGFASNHLYKFSRLIISGDGLMSRSVRRKIMDILDKYEVPLFRRGFIVCGVSPADTLENLSNSGVDRSEAINYVASSKEKIQRISLKERRGLQIGRDQILLIESQDHLISVQWFLEKQLASIFD